MMFLLTQDTPHRNFTLFSHMSTLQTHKTAPSFLHFILFLLKRHFLGCPTVLRRMLFPTKHAFIIPTSGSIRIDKHCSGGDAIILLLHPLSGQLVSILADFHLLESFFN